MVSAQNRGTKKSPPLLAALGAWPTRARPGRCAPAASGEDLAAGSMDSQLWLACAGSMCTVPPVGTAVDYFPQGHAQQATAVNLSAARPAAHPLPRCWVRFMADAQSDKVFAKIRLVGATAHEGRLSLLLLPRRNKL
ncbi:hypothetical protein QYE76_012303 [Lolium multiflorum]|uniref:Uncharacterized protein n=1 Tax=Lolium multiflorum TaxID=4521 RepID=A0AAD8TYL8_LOLMU|nr:hypothetical protein QYE76_012303 [Lolium multiflorum]